MTKIALGLDRSRFEPHVGALVDQGFRRAELENAGIPIVRFPVTSLRNISAYQGLQIFRDYTRQHNIQVVHAFDVPMDIFGVPAARLFNVPVIISAQLSLRELNARWMRAVLRWTDWLSDAVVVNSKAVGRSLRNVPKHKLHLCYNGVYADQFHPGPGRRLPGWEEAVVVGSVCAMRAEKRVEWVIESFAGVRGDFPNARLLLVGSGAETPKLEALIRRLGLEDVSHLEPSTPDVAPWLRGIDIYINSSRSESFPNGLLEAMASGCCVLGSSVGGIPELITHGEDGLVFASDRRDELAESLRLLLSDANLRGRLRSKAVETAHQRFSMKATLKRTEDMYEMLLEQKLGMRERAMLGR